MAYRDSISRVLSWLTLFMWGMFLISSKDFNSPTLFNMFRGLITLTLLRFLVKELLTFYIIFELLTLPMAIIIIGWGAQPERVIATLYILLYTIIRSMPFIIVILYFYFRQIPFGLRGLVIIPFLVKLPCYLLHFWLPKAHVEAPVYGSIVLAAILLKVGSV